MPIARELVLTRAGWAGWREETPPVATYADPAIGVAHVLPGCFELSGEDGATLYWNDGVTNEWAEWYPTLPLAMARLAALAKCVEQGEFFKDGPEGFVRWAENFYLQSVSATPKPTVGTGLE